jgi:exopolyphosphatase/guanosine-5'-triphosphate,3'-diphosphate pyrophosphatase
LNGDNRSGGDRSTGNGYEPLGVIDIGSNSVRLVVYEGAVRAPTPLFNEKVLCGLGRNVATTGRLGKDAVDRAIAALTRFRNILRILGVKNVTAIATAAAREARDGADFVRRGEKACGVAIQVLSGDREAELAAMGILMGFGAADGIAGDLGGGSLELIDIDGRRMRSAATLPLGGLRLIDVTGDRIDKARAIADEELRRIPWLPGGRQRTFYAVGGTWRALARLHMAETGYPLRFMHGYTISAEKAAAFCEQLQRPKRLAALKGVGEVSKARREVLPYGALALERTLDRLGARDVVFSVFGIREGLLYSLLSAHERNKDPLLSFCEDYARLRSRSLDHARELCAWTDAIFMDPGPRESAEERRLRHAACLISDIGWRAHPDYRGEQSLDTVAYAALAGVDHPGRLFLALSIYFRHVGTGEEEAAGLPGAFAELAGRRSFKRARIVGAAVRTAHMLSIGMPGLVLEAPLSYADDKLVLSIPQAYAGLDGERLRRRFEALARLLERAPEIRFRRL